MSSVNRAVLLGNVGKDPEVRYLASGEPVANFSLATTEKWTGKDGQKQEKTAWHRIAVFGKTAEIVRDYVTKGKQLYVEGAIEYGEYQKDGVTKQTTTIKVSNFNGRIVLLGGGNGSRGETKADDTQASVWGGQAPANDIDPDETPF